MSGLAPSSDLDAAAVRLYRAFHPTLHAMDVLDAARNIALLAGVGVIWIATARATSTGGRLRREVVVAGLVGLLLGLVAETAQLFSPVRTSSILDVMTNGLGALFGAALLTNVIAYGARDMWRRAQHRTRPAWLARLRGAPLLFIAAPYAAACWLEAFSPLGRPDRVSGVWGGPGRRWPLALAYAEAHVGTLPSLSDLLLFAPAGGLVTLWAMERGVRRWPAAGISAAVLASSWAIAELLRGVSGGDMLVWAVVFHGLASAIGAALAAVWTQPVESARALRVQIARYAMPAYIAWLLLWSWRPFVLVASWHDVAKSLTPEAFIPVAELAGLMSIHSIADVGVGALLYAPLGAWLAARAPARPTDGAAAGATGGLRALWPAFAVGLVAELAQLVIAGRTFDVTDILVEWAGVLVGAVAWRAADVRARTHGPSARVVGTPTQATARPGGGPAIVRPSGRTAPRPPAHVGHRAR